MNSADSTALNGTTRRQFLKTSTQAMAGVALASTLVRPGYAAESNTIQVALIGCGGRGTGAAADALDYQERPHQARGHGRCVRKPP